MTVNASLLHRALRPVTAAVAVALLGLGALGTSDDHPTDASPWAEACGGQEAHWADPPAFSRCMRSVPPWVD